VYVAVFILALVAAAHTAAAADPADEGQPLCWESISEGMSVWDTGQAWSTPNLATAADGHVWLAFDGTRTIEIRRWDGGSWKIVSPPEPDDVPNDDYALLSAPGGSVLRVAPDGRTALAWDSVRDQRDVLRVSTWNGSSWEPLGDLLGGGLQPGTDCDEPDMVLDEKGSPIVVWVEDRGLQPERILAARWTGEEWADLGEHVVDPAGPRSLEPDVELAPDGAVWIAWNGGPEDHTYVRVVRFDGDTWEDVGGSESGTLRRANDTSRPRLLHLHDSRTLLVWLEQGEGTSDLQAAVWDGAMWAPFSTPSLGPGPRSRVWSTSLALTGEGDPILAWTASDETRLSTVYAQVHDGEDWNPVLERMHLDSGQSTTASVVVAPGAAGDIYVAWDESRGVAERLAVVRVHPCLPGETPAPSPPHRSLESFWPSTVDEAVDMILEDTDDESRDLLRSQPREDMIQYHHGWGTGIRNAFGLWAGNEALRASCGNPRIHPDDCSMIIIEAVWDRLQEDVVPDE